MIQRYTPSTSPPQTSRAVSFFGKVSSHAQYDPTLKHNPDCNALQTQFAGEDQLTPVNTHPNKKFSEPRH